MSSSIETAQAEFDGRLSELEDFINFLHDVSVIKDSIALEQVIISKAATLNKYGIAASEVVILRDIERLLEIKRRYLDFVRIKGDIPSIPLEKMIQQELRALADADTEHLDFGSLDALRRLQISRRKEDYAKEDEVFTELLDNIIEKHERSLMASFNFGSHTARHIPAESHDTIPSDVEDITSRDIPFLIPTPSTNETSYRDVEHIKAERDKLKAENTQLQAALKFANAALAQRALASDKTGNDSGIERSE